MMYRYDGLKRMVMKKIPGVDSVLMVYDKRDRLVATQDGNMRNAGKWDRVIESLKDRYSSTASDNEVLSMLYDFPWLAQKLM